MPRKWVLAVDDDPLALQFLEAAFEGNGEFTLTTASDAMQAYIQARDLRPVLIISDINMPKFTGDAALKELRAKEPHLRAVPFIFVTALPLEKVRPLLPEGDPTVRLLPKPLKVDELKALVRELTGLKVP